MVYIWKELRYRTENYSIPEINRRAFRKNSESMNYYIRTDKNYMSRNHKYADIAIYLRDVEFVSAADDEDIISTDDECGGIFANVAVEKKECVACIVIVYVVCSPFLQDGSGTLWYSQNGREIFSW
jgi:hypothetical protein